MKNAGNILISVLIICFSLISAQLVKAEEYNLGNVMVSATKTSKYQREIGASTTVITSEDIARSGKTTVAEVLQDAPGVSIRKNSVYGGLTSIDIRGAKSGQTMVMIDGVEVYDPISIDRDFDFAHLATDNIKQIEIVRGPQSTLYGANAMTGVINIITKKGQGEQKVEALVETGSYDTFRESIGISGETEKSNYSFFVSRVDSDGVSKAKDGSEVDGYKSTTLSSRVGISLLDEAELFLVTRYTDAEFEIDDSYPTEDDVNRINYSQQFISKIGFDQIINEKWDHELSFSFINMDRRDRDPADDTDTTERDDSRYKGDVKKFQWQHNLSLSDMDVNTIGYDYQEERGTSNADTSAYTSRLDRRSIQNRGYYFQSQLELLDNLNTSAGVRVDDHDTYGSEFTYKLSGSYLLDPTSTRFKANYGTGFKAPSIYQLYDGWSGNAELSPEKSKGYDLGIEQKFQDEQTGLGITYFNNQFRNLIDYVSGSYINIKKAQTSGWEIESYMQVSENAKIGGNYTFTKTKDKDTGYEFGRRPKNVISAYVDWDYSEKGNINFIGRYVGARYDNNTNTTKIKCYYLFDLASSYDISQDVEFFWRIENIFDRQYELISGYAGLGRAVYAGVKAQF
jgi:vitamin B12 transporter